MILETQEQGCSREMVAVPGVMVLKVKGYAICAGEASHRPSTYSIDDL